MPPPGSKHAPEFDPNRLKDLMEFFEEFERLAERSGLDSKEKSKMVVRYTNGETKVFWKSLKGYGQDYEELKKGIVGSYLKSELSKSYTTWQLKHYVDEADTRIIDNEVDLNLYYWKFWTMVSWLHDKKKISEDDINAYFWKGLPPCVCKAIHNHLEIKDHTFECSQTPSVEKALEAGRFLYSVEASDDEREGGGYRSGSRERERRKKSKKRLSSDESDSEMESSSDERKWKKKEKQKEKRKDDSNDERCGGKESEEVRMKTVTFKERRQLEEDIEGLSRKLHGLNVADAEYMAVYMKLMIAAPVLINTVLKPAQWSMMNTTMTAQISQPVVQAALPHHHHPSNQRLYDPSCHFCKDLKCGIHACPIATEYVCTG
ncbi:hypothetical protein AN958_07842 [Leucoagaricus sp. SymC.cos]|nr:hypothetical protein AN958_07842 [Leucoagaricus sp. SymC.cos]